jgi:hypothetical protein
MGKSEYSQVNDGWMETHSGFPLRFSDPRPEHIVIEDIAIGLARKCRYGGHYKGPADRWYSVAEHSVHLRMEAAMAGLDLRDQLTALLHESFEAYTADLVHPFKKLIDPAFRPYEELFESVAAEKFGTIYPFPQWLHDIDSRITMDERDQVMNRSGLDWGMDHVPPLGVEIQFWPIQKAHDVFLTMARDLIYEVEKMS